MIDATVRGNCWDWLFASKKLEMRNLNRVVSSFYDFFPQYKPRDTIQKDSPFVLFIHECIWICPTLKENILVGIVL